MATVYCAVDDEDELELINDDGFVYKRKKRPRLDPATTSFAHPPPDPAAEENNRRERKKRALVKLKHKYQKEISQWEHLSTTLKDMQHKSQTLQQERHHHAPSLSDQLTSSPDPNCWRLIDELVSQADVQEAIIQDISSLCEVGETLCNAQEETLKQSFTELPIWASSPRELIISLCEGEASRRLLPQETRVADRAAIGR